MKSFLPGLLFLLFLPVNLANADPSTGFIRQTDNDQLIVFVHGYRSGGEEAWFNEQTEAFWPTMIAGDEFFSNFDIFVYDYFTQFSGRQASPGEISGNLEVDMKISGLDEYNEIVFVGHSMGGIIIRDLLNNSKDIASNVTAIVTYASPFEGSNLANFSRYLSSNPQAVDLRSGTNSYLQNVASQWLRFNAEIPSFCAYELETTYGVMVVQRNSAIEGCNSPPYRALQTDHSGTVKPSSQASRSYAFLRYAIEETVQPVAPEQVLETPEDVVVNYEVIVKTADVYKAGTSLTLNLTVIIGDTPVSLTFSGESTALNQNQVDTKLLTTTGNENITGLRAYFTRSTSDGNWLGEYISFRNLTTGETTCFEFGEDQFIGGNRGRPMGTGLIAPSAARNCL